MNFCVDADDDVNENTCIYTDVLLQVFTMLMPMSKLMSGFVLVWVLCVSDDASVHVCTCERTSNSTVAEEGARRMRRGRRRRGWGGGQLNCADDSTSTLPNMYCRVVRLSASRRICPDAAPRIPGSWSRWCSTTCQLTVTEK